MAFGEQFLHFPDLFPLRRSGEPWGNESIDVDFVGGPYRFTGLDASQVEACHERFGELCRDPSTDSSPPTVTTRVFRVGANEFIPLDLSSGWDYSFDRDYSPTAVRLAGVDFMGRLDWQSGPNGADGSDEGRATAPFAGTLWTHEPGGGAFQCLHENFFRVLVAYRLLALGGALLHSAGVVSKGWAHLFLGRSGAGKSTLSRLSQDSGRLVLSDDMNALCPAGEVADSEAPVVVEKLPFAGDLGRIPGPRSAYPLRTLNRLLQGEDAVRPLATSQAVALLIACSPFVNSDPHRLDALVANLEALAGKAPTQELEFALGDTFWTLLDEGVEPPTS